MYLDRRISVSEPPSSWCFYRPITIEAQWHCSEIYCSGVGISKGRKCCDLVNALYLWLADRAYDAFTRSQHLLPFEIPTPGLMKKPFRDIVTRDRTLTSLNNATGTRLCRTHWDTDEIPIIININFTNY